MVNQLDDNREFKDSVLGIIPKDWDVWNIEEIIYTIIDFRGRTPLKIGMIWGGGDISALSANNVEMGKINLAKETNYGSEALYKKWMNKGDTKKGDIIITMEAPLGNIAQIPDHRKYILSQRVILLKTKEDLIYNEFLKNFLLSDLFQNRLKSYSSGTTATGIQQSKLLKLPIIVPPFPEQEQIAKILDTVDKAIAQTETLIAKYKRVKTGLMQDLLTRGIDEHGQLRDPRTHKFKRSPLGMIPDEWEIYHLKDLTLKIIDGVHHTPKYIDSGIPFVTVKNLTASESIDLSDINYISPEDHEIFIKRVKPSPGDILVSKDGTLGVARIIPLHFPIFSIFVSVALLRPNLNICKPELILFFFESGNFEYQLGKLSAGTGLRHIHLEHFQQFQLAIPSSEEQTQIFSRLDICNKFIYSEQTQLTKLQKIKTGLMQDLLTGKTSVKPLLTNEP